MAETIPDILVPTDEYVSLNDLSGIPEGTDLIIQNKKYGGVWIQVSTTKPDPTSTDGYFLIGNNSCTVDSETETVWVKSENKNKIFVQIKE